MEKKKQPPQNKLTSKITGFFHSFFMKMFGFIKNFLKGFCFKRKNVLFEKTCSIKTGYRV